MGTSQGHMFHTSLIHRPSTGSADVEVRSRWGADWACPQCCVATRAGGGVGAGPCGKPLVSPQSQGGT